MNQQESTPEQHATEKTEEALKAADPADAPDIAESLADQLSADLEATEDSSGPSL